MDGRTRPHHRQLDGQLREVDKPFTLGNKKAMFPGGFGDPAEDCNCRCVSNTRVKWDLDEDELERLKERAKFFGLDKTEDFEDFKKKFLKAAEEQERQFGVMYGEDAIDVDWEYIGSPDYASKFLAITGSEVANNNVSDVVKTILKHCDGTEHEDMYLLNMEGAIISKVTDSVSKLGINYSDEFKEALETVSQKTRLL